MIHARSHRQVFDPGLAYEVAQPFRLDGVDQVPGSAFAAGNCDPRRMRQLYEARLIRAAPGADTRRVVARRPILISGQSYAPGAEVPQAAITPERLAQLVSRGDLALTPAGKPGTPRRAVSRRQAG